MNVVTRERGTREWREAHRCRVTASDAVAVMARPGTKRYAELVMRLVLDLEGHGLHTDEFPDPWAEQHEADLRAALAFYRKHQRVSVLTTGLCTSAALDWLGASPHGLVGKDGCVHFRTRKTLRAFRTDLGMTRAEIARVQLTMYVCERSWCDVVDYWNGAGEAPDKLRVLRVSYSRDWLDSNAFPRLIALWQQVRETRVRRSVVDSALVS